MVTFSLNIQPPGHGVLVCTNASTRHDKNDNTRLWWRVLDWVYFKADLTEHACISLTDSWPLCKYPKVINFVLKNYEGHLVFASSRLNCENIPLVPDSYVFGPNGSTDRAARAAKLQHMTRAVCWSCNNRSGHCSGQVTSVYVIISAHFS